MLRQIVLCLFIISLQVESAQADRGYINSKNDECPTGDGAEVFDRRENLTGAVPNGSIVAIDPLRKKSGFYWIRGQDFDGNNTSGYVHEGCVTLGSPPVEPKSAKRKEAKPADCSKFEEYVPGCKSFNDMLVANDKDILLSLSEPYGSYVCFRTVEDVFTIISVELPTNYRFRKTTAVGQVAQTAIASITRYKDGVREYSDVVNGKWTRLESQSSDEAAFQSTSAGSRLHINESEMSFSTTWKNLGGSITAYNFQVRRSTKRLLETFEWPRSTSAKNKSTEHITEQGYCQAYNFQ